MGLASPSGHTPRCCVAASGSGKSDLALRFLALPAEGEYAPMLVADDQIFVEARGNALFASVPPTIAGKLEVRGIGIIELPHVAEAELVLAVDLVPAQAVPRMPPEPWEQTMIAGKSMPCIALAPVRGLGAAQTQIGAFPRRARSGRCMSAGSGLRKHPPLRKIAAVWAGSGVSGTL